MNALQWMRKLRELGKRLPRPPKGYRHWAVVAVLTALGVFAGEWLGERDLWIRLRYRIYKYQQGHKLWANKPWPKSTRLVLLGDEEYWKGDLARRVPIKRDYLARLLTKIAVADPSVIAFDFDFRSPTPDGSLLDHADYRKETRDLVRAIWQAREAAPLVLPRSIGDGPEEDIYVPQASVFDAYPLPANVRRGYIELPWDLRQVPLPVRLTSGSALDSFASAIVRADGGDHALDVAASGKDALPYAAFLDRKSFHPYTYSAGKVMTASPQELQAWFRHKVVIVGANWSRQTYGIGGPVDDTASPIGRVEKVFIHANYVEALLNSDSRIYEPLPEGVGIVIEAGLSLVIAGIFAAHFRPRTQVLGALGACAGIVVATYVLSENLGLFFDFFIPFVLLTGHSLYEQVMEWKEKAAEAPWEMEGAARKPPPGMPPRALDRIAAAPLHDPPRVSPRHRKHKEHRNG